MSTAISCTVACIFSRGRNLRQLRVHEQALLFLVMAFRSVAVQMRRLLLVSELLLVASLALVIVVVESV